MSNKIKNIVTTVTFTAFIAVFIIMCIIRAFNPVAYSNVEKRPLAQLPSNITWDKIVDKTVIDGFEDYAVDQFPLREFFRFIKAHFVLDVLGLKENNGYAVENGSIGEIKQSFTKEILDYQIGRLEYMYEKYLSGNGGNHYVAVVPDKNYFFGKDYGYPMPDYDALVNQLTSALPEMEYIDLFNSLELGDYYKTDWHWDQSKLDDVVAALGKAMGFSDRLSGKYTENVLTNFRGGYYDQSALYPQAETMTYLTNEVLDSCTVFDYETGDTYGLYNSELYNSKTQFDFFLSGTRALLRIDNPNAKTEDKLIVFRDSYGSSLLPLLAEGYSSIYVVDLRYVHPDYVTSIIGDVDNMDVLYIFSSTILNSKTFK
ncbi:MAG: DHHW family protein [Firmicutes bacterium]|nr:DHHW family protein [Bacillota bacterium]